MAKLTPIDPRDIPDNVFRLIHEDWMLITAGTPQSFNMMTASWGGLGVLWEKQVAMCVIRPGRHTYGFVEKAPLFTLSFFTEAFRPALDLCGTKSGRDTDKAKEAGLTPIPTPAGGVSFDEARLILECRKIYTHDLDPARFIDKSIEGNYPNKDYHRLYVGEIVGALKK